MPLRPDGRAADELRPVTIQRGFLDSAPGAVLVSFGQTRVLCTAHVEESVPGFLIDSGKGWLTSEYAMLPGSTTSRKRRKTGGREMEIQRLIGRSLRAAVDMSALGQRTIYIDCDVLQADGGTRTAAITGGYVALADCVRWLEGQGQLTRGPVLTRQIAAISVGIVDGVPLLDLPYVEDAAAEVDLNVVMTGDGRFIEIQGTAEAEPFTSDQLSALLGLARSGVAELVRIQQESLEAGSPGQE